MYYLQSRYYDAKTGRFLNADVFSSTGQGLNGTNMFAYCGNNPVNRDDPSGHFWKSVRSFFTKVFTKVTNFVKKYIGGEVRTSRSYDDSQTINLAFCKVSVGTRVKAKTSKNKKLITGYASKDNYEIGVNVGNENVSGEIGIGSKGVKMSPTISVNDMSFSSEYYESVALSEYTFSVSSPDLCSTNEEVFVSVTMNKYFIAAFVILPSLGLIPIGTNIFNNARDSILQPA